MVLKNGYVPSMTLVTMTLSNSSPLALWTVEMKTRSRTMSLEQRSGSFEGVDLHEIPLELRVERRL